MRSESRRTLLLRGSASLAALLGLTGFSSGSGNGNGKGEKKVSQRLAPPTVFVGTTTGSSLSIPLNHANRTEVWVFEQITVLYPNVNDAVQVAVNQNGSPFSGAAPMIPGSSGLMQTFGGVPYLYAEAADDVECVLTGCTAGQNVVVRCQVRKIGYNDPELQGRF